MLKDCETTGSKESTWCAEGFHANRSASPVEERERLMTATSGRKCAELLRKPNPLGLLAKTLLTSPIWHSPARRLTWRAEATKCNHLLFRLAPSARSIEETEFGLLPTMLATEAHFSEVASPNIYYILDNPKKINRMGKSKHDWGVKLSELIRLLHTLKHGKKSYPTRIYSKDLQRQAKGILLNPQFAEVFMGYPVDWTKV